jgi:hypothetical protein
VSTIRGQNRATANKVSNAFIFRRRRSFQPRKHFVSSIIETVETLEAVPVVVRKKRAPAASTKEYPPHEHFGSPLNVCRVCGVKYSYVPKPYDHAPGGK